MSTVTNLQRYYYDVQTNNESQKNLIRILKLFEDTIDDFNIQEKIKVINLMKLCKVYNDKLLDSILHFTEINFIHMNYNDLLNILITNHGARRITPFELLYKMRNRFNETYREL